MVEDSTLKRSLKTVEKIAATFGDIIVVRRWRPYYGSPKCISREVHCGIILVRGTVTLMHDLTYRYSYLPTHVPGMYSEYSYGRVFRTGRSVSRIARQPERFVDNNTSAFTRT